MAHDFNFKVPKFNGTNYAYWKEKMEYDFATMPVELWESTKKGYTTPQNVFNKVIGAKLAKEIWENLKSVFEGDEKTKQAKITNLKHKFENARISDDESIEDYIHRLNEIVNALSGIGGTLEESEVMMKIMETFPKIYKTKNYVIKESHDMYKYNEDQLLSSIFVFEIAELDKIKKERREATLKVTKKPGEELEESEDMDEIEANIVRRLNRGTRNYKGNLPLKCLNYGRIAHYNFRCMYKEDFGGISIDDNKGKENYRVSDINERRDDKDKQKKSFCSTKTYSSEEEYGDDSNEESLFLAIEEKNNELSKSSEDVKNNEKLVSVKTALHEKLEPKVWIIDSGCSNHMTGDIGKFINLEKYVGGSINFVGEKVVPICRKGSISINGKHKTNDVYYVKGLRHNLSKVIQMCRKGYNVIFHGIGCEIRK
ncbi:uncharacterized protein LOC131044553 [Cryptomeria japonica]|uniref:uncharacterized protein LOC131044553 n=1 Tax=Cryptomeria japonica TaxID=3369 RepID=UPI0027D9EE82|nr:uncharacterized protein LOC131044553 [Cryptomeria japonica]